MTVIQKAKECIAWTEYDNLYMVEANQRILCKNLGELMKQADNDMDKVAILALYNEEMRVLSKIQDDGLEALKRLNETTIIGEE